VFELQKKPAGTTLTIGYTYNLYGNPKVYKAEFKLDCVKKGERVLWMHKDE
jgi:hypothetical protein